MNRLRAPQLWVGLAWLALLLSLFITLPQSTWSTSVTAALPDAEQDWQQALMRDGQSTRQVTILLRGHDVGVLENGAREIQAALDTAISWQAPASVASDIQRLYRVYAGQLASAEDWQRLKTGDMDSLLERAQQRLYGPVGLGGVSLQQDPLLLTPSFIESGAGNFGTLTPRANWLQGEHQDESFLLLTGRLHFNAFEQAAALEFDNALSATISRLREEYPDLQIHRSGAVFHAVAAAQQARFEISTYGGLSLLAIVLLLIVMFRSARPFLLTGLTLVLASASGLAALLLIFPAPHVLAMVFATTLIGVAVDYSFHGMLAVQRGVAGFKAMLPNLRLGLLTSLIGYLALLVLPFPLLQQVAVFVGTGLVAAYLTVHLLFPRLLRPGQLRSTRGVQHAVHGLARAHPWVVSTPLRWLLYPVVVVLLGGLYVLTSTDDDVTNFHQSPPALMAEEAQVRDLSQQMWSPAMLVVRGDTTEQLLQREEQLHPALGALRDADDLHAWQALSRRVPSIERQQAVQRGWREQVNHPAFAQYLSQLGLPVAAPTTDFLTPAQMPGVNQHLLTTNGERFSLILLQLPKGSGEPLQALAQAHDFAEFYSPLHSANETVAELRGHLAWWLMLALVLAWLLLCLRRGVKVSTHIVGYLIVALSCSLLLAQWVQGSLNLFNLVAALLVLALALDYAVFITSRVEPHDVIKAVGLSALTTCLAFGLLSFSYTPVIASFGVSVFAGVAAALLAAPLLIGQLREKEK
ncbi:MMPL family transporter [Aliidiomarina sp. Khilg15.8]